MSLLLSDPASGTELPLWQASDFQDERSAALNVTPITGTDSEQAFLTSLEQDARATLSGRATAPRLSRDGRFSSDPGLALAEWAVQFLAFVNGGQGDGYTIERQYRNDSVTGFIETAEWTYAGGEPYDLRWNLSFVRGQGTGVTNSVAASVGNRGGQLELDGEPLPNARELQIEKSQSVEVFRRAFAENADDNDLFSDGGARRRIAVTGDVTGDAAARNQFTDTITQTLGQDELVDLFDPFTGKTFTGMIDTYDDIDESGRTRLGEYALEFVEGTE